MLSWSLSVAAAATLGATRLPSTKASAGSRPFTIQLILAPRYSVERRSATGLSERGGRREPDRLGRATVVQQAGGAAAVEILVRLGEPGVGAAGAVAGCEQRRDGEQVAQPLLRLLA